MSRNCYLLLWVLCHCAALHAQQAPIGNDPLIVPFTPTGQDCYAPFRYGDKLYYTSSFKENQQAEPVTRIYSMEYGKVGSTLTDVNPKKSNIHSSNMTMTPDGKVMYYTLCEDETQDQCTIWSRKKSYEGGWEAASKLPPHINVRPYTATQPAIGYDWKLKKYTLYFVSDRPGGKGGKDLWYSTLELDGSYGQPMPLPFNTAKDEVTPHFNMGGKTLFFSSNGLPGYGGFDIFSTRMDSHGEWEEPINQGVVINSSYDETHFTFHTNVQKGYFVSNRNEYLKDGGEGKKHIYEIGPMMELDIPVYNIHNMTALYGTTAHVYDQTTNQKYIFQEKPFETNLKVTLLPDRMYRIVVLKDGFLPSVIEINTEGVIFPIALKQDVHLFVDEALTHTTRETYPDASAPSQEEDDDVRAIKTTTPAEREPMRRLIQQK